MRKFYIFAWICGILPKCDFPPKAFPKSRKWNSKYVLTFQYLASLLQMGWMNELDVVEVWIHPNQKETEERLQNNFIRAIYRPWYSDSQIEGEHDSSGWIPSPITILLVLSLWQLILVVQSCRPVMNWIQPRTTCFILKI